MRESAEMDACQQGTKQPWYAVYTKPRHERKVNAHLCGEEIKTFLPEIERWSRRKDRRKKILVPIFPGYLFINGELKGDSRLKVIKTAGVVKILSTDGTPTPVIVKSKRLLFHAHPYLKRGRIVRVVSGPLEGLEGIFLSEKGNVKLVISVELLHRSVSVAIDQPDIEPVWQQSHDNETNQVHQTNEIDETNQIVRR